MKKYMIQYKDSVMGWVNIQVTNTEDEARKVMSDYLKDHPWVQEVQYKRVMR